VGSSAHQRADPLLAPPINGCGAIPIIYLPAWGASRCRHSTPREAAEDRVNDKPVYPGHPPAPHAPSMLVNPSSPAKSARRAWHALRPPLCCSPPGMKMGSDSPGQLMPFPYKPRSGRVINGDEPELSSGREIRRRGCNRLHHHGATWQMITGHTKKGKVSGASACACIRGGFGTFAWTSVGR
jgi:hypothetical protein